jgi:hypothetical protein
MNSKYLNIILILTLIFSSCIEERFQDSRLIPISTSVHFELYQRGVYSRIDANLFLQKDLSLNDMPVFGLSKGNSIYIDLDVYEELVRLDYPKRLEALVAHEIGHNILGLPHFEDSRYTNEDKPIIMNSGTWQHITEDNISDMYDVLVEMYNNK